MDKEMLDVLSGREERWEMRKMLASKTQSCLITVTLCVPVAFRTDKEFWILFLQLFRCFCKILIFNRCQPHFENYIRNDDGPAFFISTKTDAREVKRICVLAEDTIPGGRMLDIDVMDSKGTIVGRSDIGLPPRKCFICENPAALCVYRKVHSPQDISSFILNLKKQIGIR